MKVESNLILLKGVFRCLTCGTKARVEEDSEFLRAPIKCLVCGGRMFTLIPEESEFQELEGSIENKALQQQLELSEIWDGHLYNELIQKAMLEIESRSPLRKLPKARREWERLTGMRRGSS